MINPLTTHIDAFGIWHVTLFWGLLAISAAFVIKQPAWIPLPAKMLWIWVLGSALLTLEFPSLSYGINHTAFMATAGQTFAEALLIPLAAIYWPGKIRKFLPFLVALELWSSFFANQGRGLLHQGSFDLALVALCLPFVPLWLGVIGLYVIFTHHCSTALMVLAGEFMVFAWYRFKYALLMLPIFAIVARLHSQGGVLGGSERLRQWEKFLHIWNGDMGSTLFGVGAGSFTWSSLIATNFEHPKFLYAHNDWLQVGYEYGALGLALMVLTFGIAWKRASGKPIRRGAVLGAALFGLTYSPLRFLPSAVVVALIFRDALVNEANVEFASRARRTISGCTKRKDRYANWGWKRNWPRVAYVTACCRGWYDNLSNFRIGSTSDFCHSDKKSFRAGVRGDDALNHSGSRAIEDLPSGS